MVGRHVLCEADIDGIEQWPSTTAHTAIARLKWAAPRVAIYTCAEFERELAQGTPSPWPDWAAAAAGLIDGIVALMQGPVSAIGKQ